MVAKADKDLFVGPPRARFDGLQKIDSQRRSHVDASSLDQEPYCLDADTVPQVARLRVGVRDVGAVKKYAALSFEKTTEGLHFESHVGVPIEGRVTLHVVVDDTTHGVCSLVIDSVESVESARPSAKGKGEQLEITGRLAGNDRFQSPSSYWYGL